jgi:hypothetical protein
VAGAFVRRVSLLCFWTAAVSLSLAVSAWAFEPDPFKAQPIPTNETLSSSLSREDIFAVEEPVSFFKFIAERTQIGLGYDAVFDDNILLEDNLKRDDIIQTIEGVLTFHDPRGSILYGAQYEVNAFRYTRSNVSAVNHDLVAYFDLDPGGRTRFRTDYTLTATNSLTFGTVGVDILRTGTDFQRTVEHAGTAHVRYELTKTNHLSAGVLYSVFDDQTVNDASTDRQHFRSTLDLNHELTPTWTLFTGTAFETISVPGDKMKNDNAYGGRLGARYDLNPSERLDATFELQRPQFKDKERDTDLNFAGTWTHLISRRTKMILGVSDARKTSFASGRSQFRSRVPNLSIDHALTPRVTATFKTSYEKQRSTVSGDSTPVYRQYNLRGALKWQVREQLYLTLEYSNTRSKSRDITSRIASFGVEGSF